MTQSITQLITFNLRRVNLKLILMISTGKFLISTLNWSRLTRGHPVTSSLLWRINQVIGFTIGIAGIDQPGRGRSKWLCAYPMAGLVAIRSGSLARRLFRDLFPVASLPRSGTDDLIGRSIWNQFTRWLSPVRLNLISLHTVKSTRSPCWLSTLGYVSELLQL